MKLQEIEKKIAERFKNIPEYRASISSLELRRDRGDKSEAIPLANGTLLLERYIKRNDGVETKTEVKLLAVYTNAFGNTDVESMTLSLEDLKPAKLEGKLPGAFCPMYQGALWYICNSVKVQIDRCELIYSHTGWIKPDGETRPVFLHGGGAIGASSEIKVELDGQLSPYSFSAENHEDKWDVFKQFARVAPKRIMYPLIAFAALSPLNHFMREAGEEPAFLMFLYGKTGTRKSTLAALLLSLFGKFNNKALPSSFKDTAKSLEFKGQMLADVLTVIDDFHPTANKQEKTEMDSKFQYLCRSYGDRTGRSRLNADATEGKRYVPKGNALITGEYFPDVSESGYSRLLNLELKSGDVDLTLLSEVQSKADRLSECMRDYISWLQEMSEKLPEALHELFLRYRERVSGKGQHGRTPEITAHLLTSAKIGVYFLEKNKVITEEEAEHIVKETEGILQEIAAEQSAAIKENDPCTVFLNELNSAIESNALKFSDSFECTLGRKLSNNSTIAGYADDEFYYLHMLTCLGYMKESLNRRGDGSRIALDDKTLKKRLVEAGYAKAWPDGKPEHKKRFGSQSIRVLYLKKSAFAEITGAELETGQPLTA